MRKFLLSVLFLGFLTGCGHPVTIAALIYLLQGEEKKKKAPAPLEITTTSLPYAINGIAYNEQVTATGGTGTYTWNVTVGSPPSGINLDPDTGILSGTPSGTVGDYTFTVEVDDGKTTATQDLTITLYNELQITFTPPLPDAVNTQPYGPEAITVTGGTNNYTWTVTSGGLPSGLFIDEFGQITGTPNDEAKTYSFTITVSDDATPAQSDSIDLTLNLYDVLNITTTSLPYAVNGEAYNQPLSAVGGTGTYTWALDSGTLPNGLNVSGGAITGTPNDTPRRYNFTVRVDDDGNPAQSDTQPLSIVLYDDLVITTGTTLPDAVKTVPYSQTLTAKGGTGAGTYTWSNPTGDLPAWLSLDPNTGELSGIPPSSGTHTFTIRVTDSETPPQTYEDDFTLTVVAGLVWEDTFDDTSKISTSSNIEVSNGYARLSANVGTERLDARYVPDDDTPEHQFGNTTYIAQVFTVQVPGKLTAAALRHRRDLASGANRRMTLEIRNVVSGQPGNRVLASVTWRPAAGWDWKYNTFSSPPDAWAGQQLALVARGRQFIHYATSDPSNPYTGGDAFISTDSGANWSALPANRDIGFGIFVTPFTSWNSPGTLETVEIAPASLSQWNQVGWNAQTPSDSSIVVQVLYFDGANWVLIPDTDLPNNSSGFTTSPIDLSGLDTTTYPALRLRGTLTESSGGETPRLFDWRVTYYP